MASCTAQELLRTPRVLDLSLAVGTGLGAQEAPAPRFSLRVTLGAFLLDEGVTPLATESAARSTREELARLAHADSVLMDPLS